MRENRVILELLVKRERQEIQAKKEIRFVQWDCLRYAKSFKRIKD